MAKIIRLLSCIVYLSVLFAASILLNAATTATSRTGLRKDSNSAWSPEPELDIHKRSLKSSTTRLQVYNKNEVILHKQHEDMQPRYHENIRRKTFIHNDPVPRACADFNYGAAAGALAGLMNVYTCPADGFQRVMCSEEYPIKKDLSTIKATSVTLNDVAFFILLGPNSKTDAFYWWLPMIAEPTDIVLVADACPDGAATCEDSITRLQTDLKAKFTSGASFHIARVKPCDVGYQYLSCKLRTGANLTVEMFPNKKFYFKFDSDTLILPKRFLSFLRTLDAVVDYSQKKPLYFGTVVESGMNLLLCGREDQGRGNRAKGGLCYGQGGAGYGLDNLGMRVLAGSQPCVPAPNTDKSPEDTFTAIRMFDLYNASVIHCGAFSSSELVDDIKFKHTITFHYIDANWLKRYGEQLKGHLHNDKP